VGLAVVVPATGGTVEAEAPAPSVGELLDVPPQAPADGRRIVVLHTGEDGATTPR
jgi:hypothetical protein